MARPWQFRGFLAPAFAMALLATLTPAARAMGTVADVTVTGFSRGYSRAALENLIQQGVDQAIAGPKGGEPAPLRGAAWSFSVQPNGGNRPLTLVAARFTDANARTITGYFTSAALGTTPADVFIGEVRLLATRLMAQDDAAR